MNRTLPPQKLPRYMYNSFQCFIVCSCVLSLETDKKDSHGDSEKLDSSKELLSLLDFCGNLN